MNALHPLAGLVVADFTRILAGPLCTMLLADAGARVIKVEEPTLGDETRRWGPPFHGDDAAYYLSVNRNKESVAIDLRSEEGKAVARRLIGRADVVVDNFRTEQRSKLGLDPALVRSIAPRAVHCSIVGFDPDCEESALPGFDLLAQAAGGIMAITGPGDGAPHKVGVAISDVLTAHWAHGAILGALYRRERSGEGSHLEISLIGATAASLVNVAQNVLVTGAEAKRYGNEHPSIVPYQSFAARDGDLVIAATSERQWTALCRDVLGSPQLLDDSRFGSNADRVRNREDLVPLISEIVTTRTVGEWIERCRAADVPAAAVEGVGQMLRRHSQLIESVGDLKLVRNPLRIDGSRRDARSAPPRHGEHTDAVLAEIGYEAGEIEALRDRGIVR